MDYIHKHSISDKYVGLQCLGAGEDMYDTSACTYKIVQRNILSRSGAISSAAAHSPRERSKASPPCVSVHYHRANPRWSPHVPDAELCKHVFLPWIRYSILVRSGTTIYQTKAKPATTHPVCFAAYKYVPVGAYKFLGILCFSQACYVGLKCNCALHEKQTSTTCPESS